MSRRQTVNPLIRAQVVEQYGNDCWLNMPGCKRVGQEDDHIVPFSHGGRDSVANLRRACKHCNATRQDRVLSGYGATIHALLAPPCADWRAWLAEHKQADSVVVSFDGLLHAMVKYGAPSKDMRRAAAMAWDGAYRSLSKSSEPVDVWLVRTLPRSRSHPDMLSEWIALDYDIHVLEVEPSQTFNLGLTAVEERVARQWYALGLSQRLVDARATARRQRLEALGLRRGSPPPSRPEW